MRTRLLTIVVTGLLTLVLGATAALAANQYNYKAITNGGANRFWVTETDVFKVAGSDVAGRESYGSLSPWLNRAADLYDGLVVSNGVITGDVSPNQVQVQDNAIVKISGENVGGQFRWQFDSVEDGESFADFLRDLLAADVELI